MDIRRRGERTTRSELAHWVDIIWCSTPLMLIAGPMLALPYLAVILPVLLNNGYYLTEMIPWLLPAVPGIALTWRGLWLLRGAGSDPTPSWPVGEKQLLIAIRDSGGSITPVEAALETSLTVDEAEEILSRLADRGHLIVRSHDDALFYTLPGRRPDALGESSAPQF